MSKQNSQIIIVDNRQVKVDNEGFLVDLKDWNRATATVIAENENIVMSNAHWEIIDLLRSFYQQFELSPTMRPLVKHIANKLGKDKGNSIYLLTLFPQSPAKLASKIAGLPKPTNCI